jgi:integrase
MRVRLKGINSRGKVLKDGTSVTYWYAWKGGPRLRGEPGDPEFVASYHEAVSQRKAAPAGILLSLLQRYQESSEFLSLADRTRRDYVRLIKVIEREFGDFPIAALADRGAKDVFRSWRDRLAFRSRRQADYAWVVLALIIAWALDRGLVTSNPCERGGRLYRGSRRDKVWTLEDEIAFLDRAPRHLHLALQLALWTGQRQGDLLRLTWAAYDGNKIILRQSKTGARVVIPVGSPLKAALDATAKRSPVILVNSDGRPWTADGFRSSWRKACRSVGIVGVTFNDLRGTAVTRLALAGATEAEIATVTGHTLGDVRSILDANYLHRDPALAEAAIRKLESRTKVPDRAPDCA